MDIIIIYSYPIKKVEASVKPQPAELKTIKASVEAEPAKLKTIEKKPIKLEPTNKVVYEKQMKNLLELNEKLISKQIFVRNIPNTRNNIVKQGMMNTINRGRKYNK